MGSSLLSSSSSSSMSMIQHSTPCLTLLSSRKQHKLKPFPFSRHLLVTSSASNKMEFKFSHCMGQRASKNLLRDLSDIITLKKSLVNNHLKRPHPNVGDSSAPNVSYNCLLTFVTLFGLFTLQGSQPALASSEFSSALQSITYLGDIDEIKTGFASAFLLIFFSELGDKTFFIAALLAARNSAPVVFLGTFGALASMTIISVALGRTFHYVDEILPFRFGETDLPLDDIAAVCLLLYFGISTLIDATSGDGLKADEEQKEAELAVSDFTGNGAGILAAASTVASTFLLVFVAEWGDKSFFSTIGCSVIFALVTVIDIVT